MLPETNQHVVINDSQPRVPMETQIKNSPMNQGNPITCMDMTKFLQKRTLSYPGIPNMTIFPVCFLETHLQEHNEENKCDTFRGGGRSHKSSRH